MRAMRREMKTDTVDFKDSEARAAGRAASDSQETIQAGTRADDREQLERRLQQLERERDEYLELLQRTRAEFENYQRRVAQEREEIRAAAQAELIAQILPVVDACERGLAHMLEEASATDRSYVEGYELLLRELKAFLEKHDVEEVPGVGADFDPNVHEAVMRELTTSAPENQILEEFRKGYRRGGRLLRPSQVKVAVRPDGADGSSR
ncbi:MAG TPA: nucleotide exchange factor GrpE [Acidobacteriota bacterium]|nr:nucleotide exchange factor GrpE [Acidobacteriota bacterium]HRR26034.1 nucleotide exchange factor GrpE [Acidobacteriota bacterium]HRR57147.1 nucleotide exchange factor GrpE [Acidobacteriota bacterium]